MCYRVSLRCNTFWCDTGLRAFQGIPSLLQGVTGVFHGPRGGYRVLGMLQGYWDVTASYRVFFFTGPLPKKLKYGKPRLGEVRCI